MKYGTPEQKEVAESVRPAAYTRVVDRAIQVWGAAGVSNDLPLAGMCMGTRTLRIAGGPDEVHRILIAKNVLGKAALVKAGISAMETERGQVAPQSCQDRDVSPPIDAARDWIANQIRTRVVGRDPAGVAAAIIDAPGPLLVCGGQRDPPRP